MAWKIWNSSSSFLGMRISLLWFFLLCCVHKKKSIKDLYENFIQGYRQKIYQGIIKKFCHEWYYPRNKFRFFLVIPSLDSIRWWSIDGIMKSSRNFFRKSLPRISFDSLLEYIPWIASMELMKASISFFKNSSIDFFRNPYGNSLSKSSKDFFRKAFSETSLQILLEICLRILI